MRWLAAILFLLFCVEAEAANRFLTCTVTCTITAADTTIWGTTSGGTGASVPGSSDAVVLDAATCVGGVTCTATMGSGYNPTWQSITMGACTASTTGCIFDWSVNNNSPTLTANAAFSGTGTGTRNLKMGNGVWTITGSSGTPWNMTTTTNLTFTANSSSIVFTATSAFSRTMQTGGLSYNVISVSANSSGGAFILASAATYATFNMTAPVAVFFPSGATSTITNAFTWTGSSTSQISVGTSGPGTVATISSANNSSMSWTGVRELTFAGGGTFTATNSFDLGHNSGITITPPATSGGGRIIGGWLLHRDLYHNNDNSLAWLEKAA